MLDYPVKSVGSVQKYPKTVKILDTTSKIGRENPKIALRSHGNSRGVNSREKIRVFGHNS